MSEININYNERIKQWTISNEDGNITYGGSMEECMKNYKLKMCKCAPSLCPQISIEENIDGNKMLLLSDDFGGVAQMTPIQFYELAKQFIEDYDNGII